MQDQSVQEFELAEAKITHSCCCVSLLAQDSNSDVGLLDHSDIIAAITNCQNCKFHLILDKLDNSSLLFWRASTEDHRLSLIEKVDVQFNALWIIFRHHLSNVLALNHESEGHCVNDLIAD